MTAGISDTHIEVGLIALTVTLQFTAPQYARGMHWGVRSHEDLMNLKILFWTKYEQIIESCY